MVPIAVSISVMLGNKKIIDPAYGRGPKVSEWHVNQNIAAGVAALKDKDYAKAEELFSAALRDAETYGSSDPRLIPCLENLAFVFQKREKP